ncbi:FadR/GntR family transcriptional regulator [Atopobacter phocae]|uniref:FadR/GntR family transcriptional regulator n=1 Tax=Atopobacter phocae TaxID=136492 RepID=UPI0004B0DB02|nr:FCD domain-containing protein [Atopobacter phocae]
MIEDAKTLVQITMDKLLNYINEKDIQSGDRLPNEIQLSKILNVGRSTVREAVKLLESRNILEVKHGSGTYLKNKDGIIEDPLGFLNVKNSLKLTQDLFELRFLIEPRMAGLAALHATKKQIEEMENLVQKIEFFLEENDPRHLELDIELHKKIGEASSNVAMKHLIPVLIQSIALYNDYYTDEKSKESTIITHRELINAIKERNSIRANDAMIVHLTFNRQKLF